MLSGDMEKHLILLGPKANSWALALDHAAYLRAENKSVTAVSFDPLNIKGSRRSLFEKDVAERLDFQIIKAQKLLDKSEHREVNRISRFIASEIRDSIEWVEYKYKTIPVGRILCSSYARIAGSAKFPITIIPPSFQLHVLHQVVYALKVFNKISSEFSHIAVVNGRGPIDSVFLSMAIVNRKMTQALERGATASKVHDFQTSPHFAPDWWEMLERIPPTGSDSLEQTYWESRLQGKDEVSGRDWSVYSNETETAYHSISNLIVFFTSSTHEFPSLPQFTETESSFKDQISALSSLIDICQKKGKHLVIKRHPNSVGWDGVDRELTSWEWVREISNVTYIDPHSKVHPHHLIRNAEAVLCYRSTTGIEAVALNRPSRAMGNAKWAFSQESRAWSTNELEQFIENPTCIPIEVANRWGKLMSSFGRPLILFNSVSGGKAVGLDGAEYFSSDFYDKSFMSFYRRARNKLWSLKPRIVRKDT